MNEPTNADLYGVLLGIKEDIGSLKSTTTLQLEGLKNHAGRLVTLEDGMARQKGATRVWALVATTIGAIVGGTAGIWHK